MPDRARLLGAHVRAQSLALWRMPAFVAPTVALPVAFYLVVGRPSAHGGAAERAVLASFAAFAVMGVALFDFGVGLAAERSDPWERVLRVLPVGVGTRLGARAVAAIGFGAAAATPVVVVGLVGGVRLGPTRLLGLAAGLAVGAVPFVLLGITLGYAVPERSALAVANLVYLGMAWVGGLLRTTLDLGGAVGAVGAVTPAGLWSDLLVDGVVRGTVRLGPALGLLGWTLALAATARAAYLHDEGQQFR